MICKTCGATLLTVSNSCSGCGAIIESVPGANVSHCGHDPAPGKRDTVAMSDPGATRIYAEKELGKTVVYQAKKRHPIYGWLVVTEGADAWQDFRIPDEDGQVFLGEGAECLVRLNDGKLEKVHASIRLKEGKLTITDLDSVSGTMVNNQPVSKAELNDGDVIKAGDTSLKFRKC